MKLLLGLIFLLVAFNAFAKEVYECEFFGPNYFLTFEDNKTITLKNNFTSMNCVKETENFPGTELDLNVFNCSNMHDKVTYYYAMMDDGTIILSRNVVFAKDITCTLVK